MRDNCVLVCVSIKFLNPKDGKLLEIHRYKAHSLLKPSLNGGFQLRAVKPKLKTSKLPNVKNITKQLHDISTKRGKMRATQLRHEWFCSGELKSGPYPLVLNKGEGGLTFL